MQVHQSAKPRWFSPPPPRDRSLFSGEQRREFHPDTFQTHPSRPQLGESQQKNASVSPQYELCTYNTYSCCLCFFNLSKFRLLYLTFHLTQGCARSTGQMGNPHENVSHITASLVAVARHAGQCIVIYGQVWTIIKSPPTLACHRTSFCRV